MSDEAKNLIDGILGDAERLAAEIAADAAARAEAAVREAERAADEAYAANEAALAETGESIRARRKTVAELECGKIRLAARRAAIDEVYRRAEEKLAALGENETLSLLSSLLDKYAEEGDAVVLSERCRIPAEKILRLPAFGKKKLTLSEKRGAFSGGVVLEGKAYDKSATYAALVAERRDMEPELDAFLFGE